MDDFMQGHQTRGTLPSVLNYNVQLYKSLRKAGAGRINSLKGVGRAIGEQRRNNVGLFDKIRNIPNRTAYR